MAKWSATEKRPGDAERGSGESLHRRDQLKGGHVILLAPPSRHLDMSFARRGPATALSAWQWKRLAHFCFVIHPTAIVHPKAKLDSTIQVGPYAVIDEGVEIGPECVLGPHVYLTGLARIGARNRFYAGCVIGEAPQDLKYKGEPTGLRIGEDNVFREHATAHRSTDPAEETVIGSRNFLMAHSHVGHNCRVGNGVILANGALLAGYASVDDRAFISGNCLVHQFVRVGTLALMQGGSKISKDLPPFTVARGDNGICGLNTVGLRRAGMSPGERLELKQLYHLLFRRGLNLEAALAAARAKFASAAAGTMLEFLAASKRGVCVDTGGRILALPPRNEQAEA